jgi:hypothetical protein
MTTENEDNVFKLPIHDAAAGARFDDGPPGARGWWVFGWWRKRKAQDTNKVLLVELRVGVRDRLGNRVLEILHAGTNYKVYRSSMGIYVHFSDNEQEEKAQRQKFTEICPELCDLRYLITQLRGRYWSRFWHRLFGSNLYERNIAQALMMIMENQGVDASERAKKLIRHTLDMAVERVTHDNIIRYSLACSFWAGAFIAIGAIALCYFNSNHDPICWKPYLVGGMSGAVAAAFSVLTRRREIEQRPCYDSHLNKWKSAMHILTGVVAAIALLSFMETFDSFRTLVLGDTSSATAFAVDNGIVFWHKVATLGFIGGFAERLIPNLLRQTVGKIEAGTPGQAARQ